ncbi:MAG: helix-hairpin-helix domain-containing protein [Acetatifactor sp.]
MRKNFFRKIQYAGKRALRLLFLFGLLVLSGCGEEEGVLIGQPSSETGAGQQVPELEVLPESEDPEETETIVVFVCGAVRFPGLVTLPVGSRVGDALELAGGFAENADPCWVNLAQTVGDGEKIYFPTIEEGVSLSGDGEQREKSLVNLNTAGKQELCTLPGIGESRAADIIDYREEKGKFQNIRDVMKVPGIKQTLYDQIKDKITVE